MRRLFWLSLGAAAGVYAVRRLSRKAEQFTPEGLAKQVAQVGAAVRTVGDEVRAQMGAREEELRVGLGIDARNDTDTRGPAATNGDGRYGRRRDIG